jgi:hypothetical protein
MAAPGEYVADGTEGITRVEDRTASEGRLIVCNDATVSTKCADRRALHWDAPTFRTSHPQ